MYVKGGNAFFFFVFICRKAYERRQLIGQTITPSSGRRYAQSPIAVNTIWNDGFGIFPVSIFPASFTSVDAPLSMSGCPPTFISTNP